MSAQKLAHKPSPVDSSFHSSLEHPPYNSIGISAEELALVAARSAVDQKGLDIRAIDLRGHSDVADFFVIISGTSERHVKGVADRIAKSLKSFGQPVTVNGYEQGQWVLIDCGDLVVHVFYEPVRQYYEFDELWKVAPTMTFEPELTREMRSLRTGIYG